MKTKRKIPNIWIVLVIILIIIIFILSFGRITSDEIKIIPDEYRDTKEEAKRKHNRLLAIIEKKEELKSRLAKKFKQVYFFVRIGLVTIWLLLLLPLYINGFIKNLNDLLSFSEACLLIIIIMNFITFGTITNLKNYLRVIKNKTENWIYGKYINIEADIDNHKIELSVLKVKIDSETTNFQ